MTTAQVIMFGLHVVAQVTAAMQEAGEGKLTPEEALRRIAQAAQQDAAVDARVDAAIAAKFPAE